MHDDPTFRIGFEVLNNESPANYQNHVQTAERTLGQIEGYNMCLNNLAAMAMPADGVTDIESTFADENNQTP